MLRQAKFQTDSTVKADKVATYMAVLDMLFHISSFAKVLMASDPLEIIGSENERSALLELKAIVASMSNGSSNETVNLQRFFYKLSTCTYSEFSRSDNVDILQAWDDIIKLIMLVIPPMREVFLGHLANAQEVPGWMNIMSRCFRAQFSSSLHSLEDIMKVCCKQASSSSNVKNESSDAAEPSSTASTITSLSAEGVAASNALVLRRAPEILVVVVESSHLKSTSLPQGQHSLLIPNDKAPTVMSFPDSFDLHNICQITNGNSVDEEDNVNTRLYDLTAVAVVEGVGFSTFQGYFRLQNVESSGQDRWYKNAGKNLEEVSKLRVLEGNYFSSSQTADKKVHPKLLIYTRRDLPVALERTIQLVSKGGQMRALGDVAFALAMTTDNYSEARRCYEEAISLDESLKDVLSENLLNLDKIEWTQKARNLEDQGDLALANGRHREANEQYTKSLMSAVFGSPVFMRVKEKVEYITRIISLETSCHFAEKGEDNLKSGNFSIAKEHYTQTLKLNPELIHLQILISGIDKTIQLQLVRQKTHDANQAMKSFKYRQAHSLLLEAIALAPEERAGLQSVLDDLGPLIQCENALARQRAGIAAMEEKRLSAAVQLFTEAISLLPPNSPTDHAYILCDRAGAYFELKEISKTMDDCEEALKLKPDYAMAYFRLGAALFAQDQYDEASAYYEKALRYDATMQEAIKIKQRQLNTAKEVQQRKEREAERLRQQEEQKRLLEEKRLRDEAIKKEKAEKLALDHAEKAERKRLQEDEKRAKAAKEKEIQDELNKTKEVEKEKARIEKLERDKERALEREKLKVEKEKEKERLKVEKEKKMHEQQKAKEEERLRQIEQEKEKERLAKEKEAARIKKEAEDKIREEEEEKEKKRRIQERKIEIEQKKKQKEEEEAAAEKLAAEKAAADKIVADKVAAEEAVNAAARAAAAVNDSKSQAFAASSFSASSSKKNANKTIKILQNTANAAPAAASSGKAGTPAAAPWVTAVASSSSSSSSSAVAEPMSPAPVVTIPNTGVAKIESNQDFPPLLGASGAVLSSPAGAVAPMAAAATSASVSGASMTPSNRNPSNGPLTGAPTLSSIVSSGIAKQSQSQMQSTSHLQPPSLLTPQMQPPLPPTQMSLPNSIQQPQLSSSGLNGLDFDFASMLQNVAHLNQNNMNNIGSNSLQSGSSNGFGVFGPNSGSLNGPNMSVPASSSSSHLSRTVSAGFDILHGASEGSSANSLSSMNNIQRSATFTSATSSSSMLHQGSIQSSNSVDPRRSSLLADDSLLPTEDFLFVREGAASTEFQPSFALLQLAEAKRMATLQDKAGSSMSSGKHKPPPSSTFMNNFDLPVVSTGLGVSLSGGPAGSSAKLPGNAKIGYNRDAVSGGNVAGSSSSGKLGNGGQIGLGQQQQQSNGMYFGGERSPLSMPNGLGSDFASSSSSGMIRNQNSSAVGGGYDSLGGMQSSSLFGGMSGLSGLKSLGLGFGGSSFLDDPSGGGMYRDLNTFDSMSAGLVNDGAGGGSAFNGMSPLQTNESDDPLLRALGGFAESNLSSPERGISKSFDQLYLNNLGHSSGLGNGASGGNGSGLNLGSSIGYSSSVSYGGSGGMSSSSPSLAHHTKAFGSSGWSGLNAGDLNNSNQSLSMSQSSPSSTSLLASPLKSPSASRNISSSNVQSGFLGGGGLSHPVGPATRSLSLSSAFCSDGYGGVNPSGSNQQVSGLGGLGGGSAGLKQQLGGGVSALNPSMSLLQQGHQSSSDKSPPVFPTQGIDSDIVTENIFPSVTWLRNYDMHMYRWSGDASDWTEFAMHIPTYIASHLLGSDGENISEFQRLSGCRVWSDKEFLHGREELFLVFSRGPTGSPANAQMNTALEIISSYMSQPASLQLLTMNQQQAVSSS